MKKAGLMFTPVSWLTRSSSVVMKHRHSQEGLRVIAGSMACVVLITELF